MTEDMVLFVGAFSTILVLALGVPLMRHWIRRREQGQVVPDAAHLARIEQTLEAMSIELERLGENQRFVTKLLAESRREALPASGVDRLP